MSPPDVFLGPVCEYVISPVAKYAGVWNIPLMTAAAQADGFTHKQPNYPLLTRMMGSYRYTTSRTNGATCLLVYYRSLSLVFCYLITRESCASLEDRKLDPTAVQPQTGSVETKCVPTHPRNLLRAELKVAGIIDGGALSCCNGCFNNYSRKLVDNEPRTGSCSI